MPDFQIKVKVINILEGGVCPLGLKIGDEFIFKHLPPPDFCHWAFNCLFPFIATLRFGGDIPWEEKKGTCRVCCPDPNNPVVFEISRIEE